MKKQGPFGPQIGEEVILFVGGIAPKMRVLLPSRAPVDRGSFGLGVFDQPKTGFYRGVLLERAVQTKIISGGGRRVKYIRPAVVGNISKEEVTITSSIDGNKALVTVGNIGTVTISAKKVRPHFDTSNEYWSVNVEATNPLLKTCGGNFAFTQKCSHQSLDELLKITVARVVKYFGG